MKKHIRLTEGNLRRIVRESVSRMLNEGISYGKIDITDDLKRELSLRMEEGRINERKLEEFFDYLVDAGDSLEVTVMFNMGQPEKIDCDDVSNFISQYPDQKMVKHAIDALYRVVNELEEDSYVDDDYFDDDDANAEEWERIESAPRTLRCSRERKNVVRLTEGDLRKIIKESVVRMLKEDVSYKTADISEQLFDELYMRMKQGGLSSESLESFYKYCEDAGNSLTVIAMLTSDYDEETGYGTQYEPMKQIESIDSSRAEKFISQYPNRKVVNVALHALRNVLKELTEDDFNEYDWEGKNRIDFGNDDFTETDY